MGARNYVNIISLNTLRRDYRDNIYKKKIHYIITSLMTLLIIYFGVRQTMDYDTRAVYFVQLWISKLHRQY